MIRPISLVALMASASAFAADGTEAVPARPEGAFAPPWAALSPAARLQRAHRLRDAGIVLSALGVGAVVVGALGVTHAYPEPACPTRDDVFVDCFASRNFFVAVGGFAAGAALLGTSIPILTLGVSDAKVTRAEMSVSPVAFPHGGGAAIHVVW